MTLVSIRCPFCENDKVVKNGKTPQGKQRYLCKNADCSRKTFVDKYTNKACDPEVRGMIYALTVNGNGTRATGRILGISKDTVTAAIKKRKSSQPSKLRLHRAQQGKQRGS
jgi:transposase-like protein